MNTFEFIEKQEPVHIEWSESTTLYRAMDITKENVESKNTNDHDAGSDSGSSNHSSGAARDISDGLSSIKGKFQKMFRPKSRERTSSTPEFKDDSTEETSELLSRSMPGETAHICGGAVGYQKSEHVIDTTQPLVMDTYKADDGDDEYLNISYPSASETQDIGQENLATIASATEPVETTGDVSPKKSDETIEEGEGKEVDLGDHKVPFDIQGLSEEQPGNVEDSSEHTQDHSTSLMSNTAEMETGPGEEKQQEIKVDDENSIKAYVEHSTSMEWDREATSESSMDKIESTQRQEETPCESDDRLQEDRNYDLETTRNLDTGPHKNSELAETTVGHQDDDTHENAYSLDRSPQNPDFDIVEADRSDHIKSSEAEMEESDDRQRSSKMDDTKELSEKLEDLPMTIEPVESVMTDHSKTSAPDESTSVKLPEVETTEASELQPNSVVEDSHEIRGDIDTSSPTVSDPFESVGAPLVELAMGDTGELQTNTGVEDTHEIPQSIDTDLLIMGEPLAALGAASVERALEKSDESQRSMGMSDTHEISEIYPEPVCCINEGEHGLPETIDEGLSLVKSPETELMETENFDQSRGMHATEFPENIDSTTSVSLDHLETSMETPVENRKYDDREYSNAGGQVDTETNYDSSSAILEATAIVKSETPMGDEIPEPIPVCSRLSQLPGAITTENKTDEDENNLSPEVEIVDSDDLEQNKDTHANEIPEYTDSNISISLDPLEPAVTNLEQDDNEDPNAGDPADADRNGDSSRKMIKGNVEAQSELPVDNEALEATMVCSRTPHVGSDETTETISIENENKNSPEMEIMEADELEQRTHTHANEIPEYIDSGASISRDPRETSLEPPEQNREGGDSEDPITGVLIDAIAISDSSSTTFEKTEETTSGLPGDEEVPEATPVLPHDITTKSRAAECETIGSPETEITDTGDFERRSDTQTNEIPEPIDSNIPISHDPMEQPEENREEEGNEDPNAGGPVDIDTHPESSDAMLGATVEVRSELPLDNAVPEATLVYPLMSHVASDETTETKSTKDEVKNLPETEIMEADELGRLKDKHANEIPEIIDSITSTNRDPVETSLQPPVENRESDDSEDLYSGGLADTGTSRDSSTMLEATAETSSGLLGDEVPEAMLVCSRMPHLASDETTETRSIEDENTKSPETQIIEAEDLERNRDTHANEIPECIDSNTSIGLDPVESSIELPVENRESDDSEGPITGGLVDTDIKRDSSSVMPGATEETKSALPEDEEVPEATPVDSRLSQSPTEGRVVEGELTESPGMEIMETSDLGPGKDTHADEIPENIDSNIPLSRDALEPSVENNDEDDSEDANAGCPVDIDTNPDSSNTMLGATATHMDDEVPEAIPVCSHTSQPPADITTESRIEEDMTASSEVPVEDDLQEADLLRSRTTQLGSEITAESRVTAEGAEIVSKTGKETDTEVNEAKVPTELFIFGAVIVASAILRYFFYKIVGWNYFDWNHPKGPSQYKDRLSKYMEFHYKDKMAVTVLLYNGNPYTGKTTSLYWDGPQIVYSLGSTSFRHRSYAKVLDRCLIHFDHILCYLGKHGA